MKLPYRLLHDEPLLTALKEEVGMKPGHAHKFVYGLRHGFDLVGA